MLKPLRPDDPRTIGEIQLEGYVGKGGFGTVYVGFHPSSPRRVAVKSIAVPPNADATWRRRLVLEVESIKKVGGEFTAAFFAADVEADLPWVATRYVDLPTLHELVNQNGVMSERDGWWLLSSIAEALLAIHEVELVHRDLKPANVLVGLDGIKVIDFGLARSLDGPVITTHAVWAGTQFFAAPEQCTDIRNATAKSDVYALAATVTFAVAGHAPHASATHHEWVHGILPNLDGVPDDMYELLEQCLAGNPSDRPTVSEVLSHAMPRLLEPGGAPLTDPNEPLTASVLAAITHHEDSKPSDQESVSPSVQSGWTFDEPADATGAQAVATGASVPSDPPAEEPHQNLSPPTDDIAAPRPGDTSRRRKLDHVWAELWNDGITKRQDRYDG